MFSNYLKPGIIFVAIYSLSLVGWALPTQASPLAVKPLLAQINQSFNFIPPEDSGQPRTNRAGGRRDRLCNNSVPVPSLTLLLPPTNQGITMATHPTFLAYLPKTSAKQAFLTLEDENNSYFYHTTFELSEEAGIMSFSIPETAPALEPDKYYKVSLAITCGEILDPNDPVVEGWIKRIEVNTETALELEQWTQFELGSWYATNGVWFDASDVLADLLRAESDNPDAIAAWQELLQSVELDLIKNAAILPDLN